jgi:GTP-binding protein
MTGIPKRLERGYVPRPEPMNIVTAKFLTSAPDVASCPVSELREFAFIGRSNVGKSSLLNMLAGAKALAKVSATPGHTRLINFFSINNAWTLVDLPGYGYAKTAGTDRDRFQEMIAGYLCGRTNLAGVFVLIDSRHPPQRIDLEFVQWLLREAVPFALVFSKADTVKAGLLQRHTELFQEKIAAACVVLPRVFTTSAETRSGRRELLAFIGEALADAGAFA